jgi:hypothetical protein
MKGIKHLLLVAGLLAVGAAFVACGDDGDDKPKGEDTGEPDAGSTDNDTETETKAKVKPNPAIDQNFDDWEGGGSDFFMSKPEDESGWLEGNNEAATIDEHDCVRYHAYAVDNYGYGTAIEAQFRLVDLDVDFSDEDYEISFDVYLPEAMKELGVNIQFAFFTYDYTTIYSVQYSEVIEADTWTTISSPITVDSDADDYSGFDKTVNPDADPEDWQFDYVRVQAVIPDATLPEDETFGDEIEFYLDNLKVSLVEA